VCVYFCPCARSNERTAVIGFIPPEGHVAHQREHKTPCQPFDLSAAHTVRGQHSTLYITTDIWLAHLVAMVTAPTRAVCRNRRVVCGATDSRSCTVVHPGRVWSWSSCCTCPPSLLLFFFLFTLVFSSFFKKNAGLQLLPFFFSQFHCVRFCFKCDLYTLSDCTEVMFVPELYVTTGYTNRIFFSFLSFWSFRFVLEILVTTRFNYYCLSFLSVFFQVRFDGIRTFLANPSATLPGGSLGSTHFAVMRDTGSTTVCCSGVDFWSDADAGISTSAVPGGGVVVNADGNGVAVRKIFLSFLTLSDSTHLCPTASSSLCVLCSYFLLPGAFADSAYVCRMETQSHACSTPLFPLPCPP
jgi:hypothetical protein